MKTSKTSAVIIFLFLSSCARHAEKFSLVAPESDFGAVVADKNLNLTGLKPIKHGFFSNDSMVRISSTDWFTLSELLLDDPNAELSRLGQDLISEFYKVPKSATEINASTGTPPGSPYGEASIWFATPILNKKIQDTFILAEEQVVKAADTVSVDLSDLPKPYPPPEEILQKLISGLNEFKGKLIAEKAVDKDAVVDSITTSLDSKYIADLNELLSSVTWDKNVPLAVSLEKLESTLGHITEVSDFQRRHLLNQVGLAVALTKENDDIEDPESFLVFLGDLWLAKNIRKNYPERLKKIFEDLSDKQLFALATLNGSEILPETDWQSVKVEKDTIPLSDRSLVSLYLENKGDLLSDEDWKELNDKEFELNSALDDQEMSEFARVMANVPSDSKAEQRFALISAWLAIPERLGIPDQLKNIFQELSEHDIILLTEKTSVSWSTGKTLKKAGIFPQWAIDAFSGLDKELKDFTSKGSASITGSDAISGFKNWGRHDAAKDPIRAASSSFSLTKYRYAIIEALQKPNALRDIKTLFESAVTRATRERLDLALMPTASDLPSQIKSALLPQLKENAKKSTENIKTTLDQYGKYYLGKLVFNLKGLSKSDPVNDPAEENFLRNHPLPLLENATLKYSFRTQKWLAPKTAETSAELLGLTLSILPKRIQKIRENSQNSDLQVALEYEMVSKLLSVAGYHDPAGNLISSLSVAMDKKHSGEFLDIAKYDPSQLIFAVPDILKIDENFKLDGLSRINPTVSVMGQMSLLKGYAHLMEYLKPWNASPFDTGLGALRVDEEADLKPFNKADFFLLSTGLGAAILKNIPYKMLGIITHDFKYVDGTKVSDPTQISAVGAVITNYDREGLSHHVKTKDIAQAILAMAEFYEQTADLNKSNHPLIISSVEGDKLTMARNTLQKLIAGMILFSSAHLMLEDGGFVSGFDLDQMKTDEASNRLLSDQLLMEQALLTAGSVLKSGFMVSRALDNFFFLNNQFWSEDLGFYRQSENDTGQQLSLIDVARGLHIVREMLTLDVTQGTKPESVQQMKRLVQFWTTRFFGKETLSLDPVYLLSEFSL
jgi:hypothetical protein